MYKEDEWFLEKLIMWENFSLLIVII